MGILGKLKDAVADQVRPAPPKQPQLQVCGEIFYTQMFKQNNNFRGHKRFRMVVNGYDPTEYGYRDFMLSGGNLDAHSNILLRGRSNDGAVFLDVIVDGHFIGDVPSWTLDQEQADFVSNKFFAGLVTSAHIKLDGQSKYLFLKAE